MNPSQATNLVTSNVMFHLISSEQADTFPLLCYKEYFYVSNSLKIPSLVSFLNFRNILLLCLPHYIKNEVGNNRNFAGVTKLDKVGEKVIQCVYDFHLKLQKLKLPCQNLCSNNQVNESCRLQCRPFVHCWQTSPAGGFKLLNNQVLSNISRITGNILPFVRKNYFL